MTQPWRFTTLFITLLLCLGFSTSHAADGSDANSLQIQLNVAFDAFQQGRYGDAKSIWRRLADQGIESAQINLAALYDSGKGTASNPAKAASLYLTAANQGNPYAQYNLALMHIEGRGVSRDLSSAEYLLKKAADQKMASACYQLGLLYAGLHQASDIADNDAGNGSLVLDIGLAIDRMYEGGLLFEQAADAAGLERTIVEMTRIAPGDSRLEALRSKQDALANRATDGETHDEGPSTSFGTAWPLENGYVVTNYHVIAGSGRLTLQNTDGRQVTARPVLYDRDNDLALLAVDDADQLPPALALCNIKAPTGASVFTLGYPRVDILGYSPKFADGVIEKDSDTMGNWSRYLTTVDIQPGNSGGPLLNKDGEVVGVVSAMLGIRDDATGELQILPNQSCAIKIDHLHQLIGQLPDNGIHRRTIAGQGLPIQTLREKLKDSILVVIAQEESG